jgi:predicted secreted protein
MPESPITGLTASVKLGANPAGVTVGYMSGFKLNLDKKIIEIIAFGMSYSEKVPAIKDWKGSCDGTAAFVASFPQELLYNAYENSTLVTIGCYLTPTMYFEGTAYIKSLAIDAAPDDKVNVSMDFEGSGALIFSLPNNTGISLVPTLIDHATAGATQISAVAPALTGGNSYMYRVNVGLPAVGAILAAPWTAYTIAAALPAVNGDLVVLAEVSAAGAVVKRGSGIAVVTA